MVNEPLVNGKLQLKNAQSSLMTLQHSQNSQMSLQHADDQQMTLQFSANYVTMDYLDKYGKLDDDISSVDSNVEVDCDVTDVEGSIDDLYKQLVASNKLKSSIGNQENLQGIFVISLSYTIIILN